MRGCSAALLLLGLWLSVPDADAGCLGDQGYILVKTTLDSFLIITDSSCSGVTGGYIDFHFALQGFAPQNPPVAIWPGSGDPNVHDANVITEFPAQDRNGDGAFDAPYRLRTTSLKDLGTYAYLLTGHYTNDGYNVYEVQPDVMSFLVGNGAPTASPSISGTLKVGNMLTFVSNAHDPDHGTAGLHFDWSIAEHPAGSVEALSGATVPTPTLNLANKHDIGHWRVHLRLADQEGEMKEFDYPFDVVNQPPTLSISGPNEINALEHLHLQAGPPTDADGETVSFQWDLLSAPPQSSHAPQTNFSSAAVLDFVTGPGDIGTWVFKCTARDEHNATVEQMATVTVKAVPPKITLTGPSQISVGGVLHKETTTLNDAYGAPLQFKWEVWQVPTPAGVGLGMFGSGAAVDIPTDPHSAGTWRLKLTVTDQVHQTAEEVTDVLVDALPVADIVGPDQTGNLAQPLDLDGSGSKDPDTDVTYLHTDPGVHNSPGLTTWVWRVYQVPSELYGSVFPGNVTDVFGVDGSGPSLHLPPGKLQTGDWGFELEVTDGEGHKASTSKAIQVLDESIPPLAIAPPAAYTVDVSGTTAVDIRMEGGLSIDLDDLLHAPYAPGLGITQYAWQYLQPPPTCTAPPALGTTASVTLYPAGSAVPPNCQGAYQLGLTVTDNDTPTAKTGSVSTTLLIGNCSGAVCIDSPTQATPQFVRFSNQTDVVVFYHLNSLLYDDPLFAAGLRLQMQIFHESDLVHPAFDRAWDVDVLPSNKGGVLVAHWSGFDNLNQRPKSGKYTVTLQLVDATGTPTGYVATQSESIRIQTLDVAVQPGATRYASADKLQAGTETVTLNYQVTGAPPGEIGYDELRLRILNSSSAVVLETSRAAPFTGTFTWNGALGGGAFIAPGVYTAQLEILDHGASLGKSQAVPLTVYRLSLRSDSGPLPTAAPGTFVLVNDDDDNVNNVSDLGEVAPGEDDLVKVKVAVEPAELKGTVTLDSTVAPAPYKLWSTAAKGADLGVPMTVNTTATPLPAEIYVEGQSAAKTDLRIGLVTPEGTPLGPVQVALTTVSMEVMADSNNDFLITGADGQTLFVRPGLWDAAFRLAGDALGAQGTLYNEQDEARLAAVGNPENFIARDSRRFYLQVRDPNADTNAGAAEEIAAANFEWFTLKSDGTDDDHPGTATLTLAETGANTGQFVSKAVLLVADQEDRNQLTDTGLAAHPGKPGYNVADHRLRQVSKTDSFMIARYRPTGAAGPDLRIKVPVFGRHNDDRKSIKVRVFNFSDSLNNMIPAIPAATVNTLLQVLSERYAAIGVRTDITYTAATDTLNLPAGSPVNLNNVGSFTGAFQTLAPSSDQAALINLVRGVEPAGPANADTVYLLFVGNFTSGNRGESFPDGWVPAGSTAKNFVMVAGRSPQIDYVPAHEIGHILTNQTLTANEASGTAPGWGGGGHYGGVQQVNNVMDTAGGTASTPRQPSDSKRFWDDVAVHIVQQITRIRGSRFIKAP